MELVIEHREETSEEYQSMTFTAKRKGVELRAEFILGEPEDRVFYRDLGGVYAIEGLIKMAYDAGKRGEDLVVSVDKTVE